MLEESTKSYFFLFLSSFFYIRFYLKERQRERKLMKDRDEAWMRVEALAMKHPNYNVMSKGTTNNNMSYATPQHIDNSPPDEDVDTDQTPLTLEKIEARANEVRIDLLY
jgi:serine/threonine-protein phosphatase 2A regulatory subunit B'